MHVLARPAHFDVHHAMPTWARIAVGGSALALADLAFAAAYWFLHSGLAPIRVAQGVASWVIGAHAAKAHGLDSAIAGVLLYCAVVSAMVAGYARLASSWPTLHRHVLAAGIAYGVAMYGLLFRVIVPHFSAATVGANSAPLSWTIACLAAYAGIGLACALIARHERSR
jgi:hypothetical protein